MTQLSSVCDRAHHIPPTSYETPPATPSSRCELAKKVALVGLALITVTLAALAISHQLLPFSLVGLIIGIVSMGVLGYYVCKPTPFRRSSALPPLPPIIESKEPINLDSRLRNTAKFQMNGYNLRSPGHCIADYTTWESGFLQLPLMGRYESEYLPNHLMAVRLPASQLQHFPQEVQNQLTGKKNLMLFFLVFFDDEDSENPSRNIAMHAIGIPDRRAGRIEDMTIKMYHPRGVAEHPDPKCAIPINGVPRRQVVHVHPDQNNQIALSPNNARFQLLPETNVASFFVTAEGLRGRNVAFHALILKNRDSEEAEKLSRAIHQTNSVDAFLTHLNNSGFIYANEALATFGRNQGQGRE